MIIVIVSLLHFVYIYVGIEATACAHSDDTIGIVRVCGVGIRITVRVSSGVRIS